MKKGRAKAGAYGERAQERFREAEAAKQKHDALKVRSLEILLKKSVSGETISPVSEEAIRQAGDLHEQAGNELMKSWQARNKAENLKEKSLRLRAKAKARAQKIKGQ